jgi:hypothetical protein
MYVSDLCQEKTVLNVAYCMGRDIRFSTHGTRTGQKRVQVVTKHFNVIDNGELSCPCAYKLWKCGLLPPQRACSLDFSGSSLDHPWSGI